MNRIKRFYKDYKEPLNWAPELTVMLTIYIVIQAIVVILSFAEMVK